MSNRSHHIGVGMMSLFLATSLIWTTAPKAAPPGTSQSGVASQDKAKACNDAADKKGLKDQERKTFMQSCLSKAANAGSGGTVSQQDKATACSNLADKKGLTGADRRSFIKDCMNKANP